MQQLQVRFPETAKLKINSLADCIGVSDSVMARAALSYGLKKLNEMACLAPRDARKFVLIEEAKSKI